MEFDKLETIVEKKDKTTINCKEISYSFLFEKGTFKDTTEITAFTYISTQGKNRPVIFVTNGGAPIDPIKVKRGAKLENLPVPVRGYSIFCGWYKDERFTDPWYAGVDKVTKRRTKLYAKWL